MLEPRDKFLELVSVSHLVQCGLHVRRWLTELVSPEKNKHHPGLVGLASGFASGFASSFSSGFSPSFASSFALLENCLIRNRFFHRLDSLHELLDQGLIVAQTHQDQGCRPQLRGIAGRGIAVQSLLYLCDDRWQMLFLDVAGSGCASGVARQDNGSQDGLRRLDRRGGAAKPNRASQLAACLSRGTSSSNW
jgi:hypothetical protein